MDYNEMFEQLKMSSGDAVIEQINRMVDAVMADDGKSELQDRLAVMRDKVMQLRDDMYTLINNDVDCAALNYYITSLISVVNTMIEDVENMEVDK